MRRILPSDRSTVSGSITATSMLTPIRFLTWSVSATPASAARGRAGPPVGSGLAPPGGATQGGVRVRAGLALVHDAAHLAQRPLPRVRLDNRHVDADPDQVLDLVRQRHAGLCRRLGSRLRAPLHPYGQRVQPPVPPQYALEVRGQ